METTKTLVVMTMAILMKLFATRIVASNILGCSSNWDAIRAFCFSLVFKKLISFADREKKAVSAPAMIADISKSISIATISMVAFGGENASGEDICSSRDERFVSPSVLSNLYYNLVQESKLTKGREIMLYRSILLIY